MSRTASIRNKYLYYHGQAKARDALLKGSVISWFGMCFQHVLSNCREARYPFMRIRTIKKAGDIAGLFSPVKSGRSKPV